MKAFYAQLAFRDYYALPQSLSNSCLQGLSVSAGLLHFSFSLILQLNYTRIRLELTFLFQNGMLCSYNEIHPLPLLMG